MIETIATTDCNNGELATVAKKWFAVFTVPRHEKRVEAHCRVRGIESFLPLCQIHRQWKDGSNRTVEIPLFSSYLFARIGPGGRVSVLGLPGVISIVGGVRRPLPVSDSYIDFLRDGLRQGKIEPHPHLEAGAKVRIRSGLMAGMEGLLLRRKNSCRVVLTIEMLMRSIAVEILMEDIELVGHSACA